MNGNPRVGGEEATEENFVDFEAKRLREPKVGPATEIHKFPHPVNSGIAESFVFALGHQKQLIPVRLDGRMVVSGEGGETEALVVRSGN